MSVIFLDAGDCAMLPLHPNRRMRTPLVWRRRLSANWAWRSSWHGGTALEGGRLRRRCLGSPRYTRPLPASLVIPCEEAGVFAVATASAAQFAVPCRHAGRLPGKLTAFFDWVLAATRRRTFVARDGRRRTTTTPRCVDPAAWVSPLSATPPSGLRGWIVRATCDLVSEGVAHTTHVVQQVSSLCQNARHRVCKFKSPAEG